MGTEQLNEGKKKKKAAYTDLSIKFFGLDSSYFYFFFVSPSAHFGVFVFVLSLI